MATHDYVIDNQTAPNFRADLNNALLAIVSNNSSATAPAVTYANMMWYDTAANTLYMRSEADDAWISIGTLDQTNNTFAVSGISSAAIVSGLGFTPVQQGGGAGQLTNKVYIGWDGGGLKAQVDSTDLGRIALEPKSIVFNTIAQFTAVQNTRGQPAFFTVGVSNNNSSSQSVFELQVSFDGVNWVAISRDSTLQDKDHAAMGGFVLRAGNFWRVNRVSGGNTSASIIYQEAY